MILSRPLFFILLFVLLTGPIIVPRLLWYSGTKSTSGKVSFVGHDGLGSTLGIRSYPVILFCLGKDSIFFNGMNGYGYRPGDPVPVRYRVSQPSDARIDQPLSLWGSLFVVLLVPIGIWLVLLLTPERFQPLIPRRSNVELLLRKPFIRIRPQETPNRNG